MISLNDPLNPKVSARKNFQVKLKAYLKCNQIPIEDTNIGIKWMIHWKHNRSSFILGSDQRTLHSKYYKLPLFRNYPILPD